MIRDESGQSIVEFALLLPVMLLLLIGVLDFGRIVYSYGHLHMAAQESVRKGALGSGDIEITNFAKNYVNLGDSTKLQVTISPLQPDRKSGDYLKVTLKYPLKIYTPLLSNVLPVPEFIQTDSTVRVE